MSHTKGGIFANTFQALLDKIPKCPGISVNIPPMLDHRMLSNRSNKLYMNKGLHPVHDRDIGKEPVVRGLRHKHISNIFCTITID